MCRYPGFRLKETIRYDMMSESGSNEPFYGG